MSTGGGHGGERHYGVDVVIGVGLDIEIFLSRETDGDEPHDVCARVDPAGDESAKRRTA